MKIYHNPRCAKSRQTLGLLQDHGVEPEVILYLSAIPSHDELQSLLTKLGISPLQLGNPRRIDRKGAGQTCLVWFLNSILDSF